MPPTIPLNPTPFGARDPEKIALFPAQVAFELGWVRHGQDEQVADVVHPHDLTLVGLRLGLLTVHQQGQPCRLVPGWTSKRVLARTDISFLGLSRATQESR